MGTNVGNAAERLPENETIEEPSMEEILSSIKQIIADDEQRSVAPEKRENYTHPENPSNSNSSDSNIDEVELSRALQDELNNVAVSETESEKGKDQHNRENLETRVAAVRAELSSTSQALTPEERLKHYRTRNKLKTESLAEQKVPQTTQPPLENAAPVVQSAAATRTEAINPPSRPVQRPLPIPSAQTVESPSSEVVAQEMATIMLQEKSGELELMLADLMRPTIRQWLNDNLPSMVQRLVREEIRAASRGQKTS